MIQIIKKISIKVARDQKEGHNLSNNIVVVGLN
jgi:hypothetical protein